MTDLSVKQKMCSAQCRPHKMYQNSVLYQLLFPSLGEYITDTSQKEELQKHVLPLKNK